MDITPTVIPEDAVLAFIQKSGRFKQDRQQSVPNTVNAVLDDNYARAGIGGRGVIIPAPLKCRMWIWLKNLPI